MKKTDNKKKQWNSHYLSTTLFGLAALIIITIAWQAGVFLSEAQRLEYERLKKNVFQLSDDDPSLGSIDAPVHIVEFSDFQCPFCKKAAPIMKEIMEEYGDKIHFVYRDFPVKSHFYSQKAAEAGECADDQGKFWELHDEIFNDQKNIRVDDLKKKALKIGVFDMIEFNMCLDSGKYEEEVRNDYRDGELANVRGTPTFFINGEVIPGAVPKEMMLNVIKKYLNIQEEKN